MTTDAALNDDFDLQIDERGDIKTADFFDTAIIYSLFGERRAAASEVTESSNRRGWIGSESMGYENGSKLWLYSQARLTRTVLASIEDEAAKCLAWLVDYGYAVSVSDVRATLSSGRVMLGLNIGRDTSKVERRYYELWNNTGL